MIIDPKSQVSKIGAETAWGIKHYDDDPVPEFLIQADGLECAKRLDTEFSRLFMEMKHGKLLTCRFKMNCRCRNPVFPSAPVRVERFLPGWYKQFDRNREMAMNAASRGNLDLVMLGDSITYGWKTVGNETWNNLFEGHAVPLGIPKDTITELLYRMTNGEVPKSLRPKAWSLLIGTNDYHSENCNKESLLVGNLAVINMLLSRQRPASKIILNHPLPRGSASPLTNYRCWQDYKWVGERFQCLAQLPGVEFFNGTSFFVTDDGTKVNQTMLEDFVHPSELGYIALGGALRQKLEDSGVPL
jgi:hypothetical protein